MPYSEWASWHFNGPLFILIASFSDIGWGKTKTLQLISFNVFIVTVIKVGNGRNKVLQSTKVMRATPICRTGQIMKEAGSFAQAVIKL